MPKMLRTIVKVKKVRYLLEFFVNYFLGELLCNLSTDMNLAYNSVFEDTPAEYFQDTFIAPFVTF